MSDIKQFKAAWKDYFGNKPTKSEVKRNFPYWKKYLNERALS